MLEYGLSQSQEWFPPAAVPEQLQADVWGGRESPAAFHTRQLEW